MGDETPLVGMEVWRTVWVGDTAEWERRADRLDAFARSWIGRIVARTRFKQYFVTRALGPLIDAHFRRKLAPLNSPDLTLTLNEIPVREWAKHLSGAPTSGASEP